MAKSMTGFGRAEIQDGKYQCKAEIRSVNNRFIEINARLPKAFLELERPVKNLIKGRCARGSFDLTLSLEQNGEEAADLVLKANLPLAAQYARAYGEIRDALGLKSELDINTLAGLRDVVKAEPLTLEPGTKSLALATVDEALSGLEQMRAEEGANLHTDISGRIESIEQHAREIRGRQGAVSVEYKERLQERIRILTEGIELDTARLAQEVALLADRADVTEEVIRLDSHLKQFRALLSQEDPVGRKLEFITQEINREVNTVGSKTVDAVVSRAVIEIKSELEKIREQLQNIE